MTEAYKGDVLEEGQVDGLSEYQIWRGVNGPFAVENISLAALFRSREERETSAESTQDHSTQPASEPQP